MIIWVSRVFHRALLKLSARTIMPSSPLPSSMKAFVVQSSNGNTNPNPLDNGQLMTIPLPTIPSTKYALIKVLRAGICNTDLEILQGYMGFTGTLGHEFVGRVVKLHDDASDELKEQWINERVCGDINLGCCNDVNRNAFCGVCDDKLAYDGFNSKMSRNHCPNRTVLGILNQDGTFAEYMILPIVNLHKVPEGMPNEVAVFAEPLAAACRIVEQGLVHFTYADIERRSARGGDKVAILGDGKLGLCVSEILGREYLSSIAIFDAAKPQPPAPILFGKHRDKLDLVADCGVQTRLVSECYQDDEQKQVSSDHLNQYDVVIDATGNPNGLKLSMSLCRPMGVLVLKSTCAAGVSGFHSAPIVIDELMVVGSRCGPIERALELMSAENTANLPPFQMEKYVTKTFPLGQAREALACAAEKSTMKVQLVMEED
ncbi:hypothetical protein HJC23_007937 [Cyclotella cryptica]|uniref:Alcohol dehydrogenase-like N-terminal domain-containing protein n=1 Tax=Cyclotella cryptica TaxID=29204 RepID=A0ABD3PCQ8_9STRA